jgi:purine-binding chemotaxis protein CheW
MRQQLGLPTMEAKYCMNIILKLRDEFYSLQVDSVADVVVVQKDNFEIPPETLPIEIRRFITGTYKVETKLLHILDIEQILEDKSLSVKEKQSEILV